MEKAMRKLMLGARAGIIFLALWATSNVVLALTLSPFTNFVFNSPIGIDFHEPSGELLMSVFYPTGSPHNFDLVAANGSPTQFGPVAGLTEEVKVATVRLGAHMGGFTQGEAFSGNGVPGSVVRLLPNGTPVNPVFPYTWATLPGEPNLLRGSLFQDRFGVAGGNLIVVTGNEENGVFSNDHAGNVWRVNSLGVASLVATIGHHLEGVTTVPNDPQSYGPLAGKIIAGDEDFVGAPACTGAPDPSVCNGPEGKIWAVDPTTGFVFTIGGGVGSGTPCVGSTGTPNGCHYHTAAHFNPEDLDIIRGNAEFFGVAFRDGLVLTAPASDFAALCGQVLVTQEFPFPNTSGLSALTWDGTQFVATLLTSNRTVQQWEHTTFTSGQDCFGITIVKSPKNGTFVENGQATFTIVVTATGANADTNVVLTDQLPSIGGLVWQTATASNGAICSITATNFLTCNLGTIQPGAANAVTVTVNSTLNTPAAACTTQPNPDAHVTADHGLVADDSGSLSCTPTLITVTQGGWGSTPHGNNPGTILQNNFSKIGPVIIGCTTGFKDTFTSSSAIHNFLPQGGTPGVLTVSATNPLTTTAGVFAGQVLALEINVLFSNVGVLPAGLGAFVITSGPATGKTINQVLADANKALGGCGLPSYVTSISQLNDVVTAINEKFDTL